ncbi:MAG: dehydrogenase [Acidimicrobiales bacterium]|nr:MAG: dehydrogenase [Acidimicrobiales bacterium]
MTRPTALVTGASRGIGKATAIALAGAGFDVAITARTMVDGDRRLEGDDSVVVPGGLDTTAAAIEVAGGRAVPVFMDLMDRSSVSAAVATAETELGALDVVVNNAIYQGPGAMVEFADLTDEMLANLFEGNLFAQLAVVRAALPRMIDAGGGIVVNIISATARATPKNRIGQGGWGMGYAMTKAAFERVAPLLEVEHRDDGIRAFNIDPGHVPTERQIAAGRAKQYEDNFTPGTPAGIGAAIAWVCTDPDAAVFRGRTVHAQELVRDRDLLANEETR